MEMVCIWQISDNPKICLYLADMLLAGLLAGKQYQAENKWEN
jgi:hypothetical protein